MAIHVLPKEWAECHLILLATINILCLPSVRNINWTSFQLLFNRVNRTWLVCWRNPFLQHTNQVLLTRSNRSQARYKYLQIFQIPETMESFNFDFFQTIVKQKPVEGNYMVNLALSRSCLWLNLVWFRLQDKRCVRGWRGHFHACPPL